MLIVQRLTSRTEEIKHDKRHVTMLEFSKIHGVGASTARELYDRYNCRTLADVEAIGQLLPSMGERSTQREQGKSLSVKLADTLVADVHDFDLK